MRPAAPVSLSASPPPARRGEEKEPTAQQPKVIRKRPIPHARPIRTDRPAQEQDQDDRRRDPKRPVQVRVPLEHVQEAVAREQRGPAPREDRRGVDVEELRVEGEGPEEPLAAAARGGGCRRGEGEGRTAAAGAAPFPERRAGFGEVGGVEFEVVILEIGVAEVALWEKGSVWERWRESARAPFRREGGRGRRTSSSISTTAS